VHTQGRASHYAAALQEALEAIQSAAAAGKPARKRRKAAAAEPSAAPAERRSGGAAPPAPEPAAQDALVDDVVYLQHVQHAALRDRGQHVTRHAVEEAIHGGEAAALLQARAPPPAPLLRLYGASHDQLLANGSAFPNSRSALPWLSAMHLSKLLLLLPSEGDGALPDVVRSRPMRSAVAAAVRRAGASLDAAVQAAERCLALGAALSRQCDPAGDPFAGLAAVVAPLTAAVRLAQQQQQQQPAAVSAGALQRVAALVARTLAVLALRRRGSGAAASPAAAAWLAAPEAGNDAEQDGAVTAADANGPNSMLHPAVAVILLRAELRLMQSAAAAPGAGDSGEAADAMAPGWLLEHGRPEGPAACAAAADMRLLLGDSAVLAIQQLLLPPQLPAAGEHGEGVAPALWRVLFHASLQSGDPQCIPQKHLQRTPVDFLTWQCRADMQLVYVAWLWYGISEHATSAMAQATHRMTTWLSYARCTAPGPSCQPPVRSTRRRRQQQKPGAWCRRPCCWRGSSRSRPVLPRQVHTLQEAVHHG
jgi:hypothetical protein